MKANDRLLFERPHGSSQICFEILPIRHKFYWSGSLLNCDYCCCSQRYFKTFVLKKDEIGIISAHGYQPNGRTSIQATQWLEWQNTIVNGCIQHGRTKNKVRIGRYFVDVLDQQTKTVHEYNECVFYGHSECTEKKTKSRLIFLL